MLGTKEKWEKKSSKSQNIVKETIEYLGILYLLNVIFQN
jgi:hypothetical protein